MFLLQVSYGWVFPSLPLTTTYQVWLSYTNPGADTALGAMVTSEELFYNARVVFRHCPPPTACHTPLVMSFDITTVASFVLIAGASPILTLTLSNIELNLVRKIYYTTLSVAYTSETESVFVCLFIC